MSAVTGEHRRLIVGAQAEMDVAGVSGVLVELGHEREAVTARGDDLFGRELRKGVIVRGSQGVSAGQDDLMLARRGFGDDVFHLDAGIGEIPVQICQQ